MSGFKIDVSAFQKVVQFASGALSRIPQDKLIFNALFFIVEDSSVKILSSNGEITTSISFECSTTGKCSFAVPGVLFTNAIRQVSGKEIEIELQTDQASPVLLVSSGKLKYKVNTITGIDESQYNLPSLENSINTQVSIPSTVFYQAISMVSCCVNVKRQNLNCILMHSESENAKTPLVSFVTTDGMRLAILQAPLESDVKVPNILLPKKSCDYIASILSSYTGDVKVDFSRNSASFLIGKILVTTKLLDSEFPRYQAVIPSVNNKILDVKTAELKKGLKSVLSVITGVVAKIKLVVQGNTLEIVAEENGNTAIDSIEVSFSESPVEPLSIVCDASLLLEILDKIDTTITRFAILDHKSPILIRPLSELNLRYVFMPMIG